ncbi:Protein CBG22992 [Caenorhabditis briggsae]|nr:Protein CBG22992 [Caenorhabditis briggsae]CAP39446.1 Protein CBG22992 [Caenorhabditis briggsae]
MNFLPTVFSILLLISLTSAQFFFPFGMGSNSNGYNNNYYNGGGQTYGNGYGVKDSEGFFAMCKGWTCQN